MKSPATVVVIAVKVPEDEAAMVPVVLESIPSLLMAALARVLEPTTAPPTTDILRLRRRRSYLSLTYCHSVGRSNRSSRTHDIARSTVSLVMGKHIDVSTRRNVDSDVSIGGVDTKDVGESSCDGEGSIGHVVSDGIVYCG